MGQGCFAGGRCGAPEAGVAPASGQSWRGHKQGWSRGITCLSGGRQLLTPEVGGSRTSRLAEVRLCPEASKKEKSGRRKDAPLALELFPSCCHTVSSRS